MRAELVAVGTELLLGQIVDTHSAYLSRFLSELGIDVYYHTSVGDNRERLKDVIRTAQSRSDLVLFTGGLGPTEDDLTKEAVADVLGLELIVHPPSVQAMETLFTKRGLEVPPSNYKQALVFPGGTVFSNPNGTAPGVAVTHERTTYILLPGPPVELYPMVENEVRVFLERLRPSNEVLLSHVLRFFGIGESHLVERIAPMIRDQANPTIAPLSKEGEVTVRLTAKAPDHERAWTLIRPVKDTIVDEVGQHLYGVDDDTLEVVVIRALAEKGNTLAVAESCTGGLIARMLTSVPGAGSVFPGGVVTYSDEAKHEWLGVSKEQIETDGAISESVARSMAKGAMDRLDADWGISVTGVAGPDPAEGKPVGLVYLGIAEKGRQTSVHRLSLRGSREKIQIWAAKHALFILLERLKKGETTR
ncbi:competence/damage-inducible protein A [Desmospora profundinema]|uniref:Putative competence-damage inducible protein n=1 Tax=Desmospora profundinema TaxID=1571184 RepID=A0ABU1IIM4_9BACL|nr:competence/damage-inducible protein A [Desmospora profundinema]MDR6224253.1 nicotinamide-nucleotide amidase [Desmospora profundinema]